MEDSDETTSVAIGSEAEKIPHPVDTISEDRFYRVDQEMEVDEDKLHEFKAHRSFTFGNICPTSRHLRSVQPVSKSINAMLNTGAGGIIYLGVSDDGIVKGLPMTLYQRDHVRMSLIELLKKYTPVVPPELVELVFVRTLAVDEEPPLLDTTAERRNPVMYDPHSLGRPRRCWCDEEAGERQDEIIPNWVVEVHVRKWNPKGWYERKSPLVTNPLRLHPVFNDEYGMVYFRDNASNCSATMMEILERTTKEVNDCLASFRED